MAKNRRALARCAPFALGTGTALAGCRLEVVGDDGRAMSRDYTIEPNRVSRRRGSERRSGREFNTGRGRIVSRFREAILSVFQRGRSHVRGFVQFRGFRPAMS